MTRHITIQTRQRRCSFSFCPGNTLVEYSVITILLIMMSIGALQLVSSSFNLAMARVRDEMKVHQQSAIASLLKKNAQSTGYNTTLTPSQLAQLQLSLSDKLQTTGANGSTELLANQIAGTAALLLSQGKIDQTQYDILMKLSNQGHRMAQIEGMLSQAVAMSNGNFTIFSATQFVIDGQTYRADTLSDMIGFKGPSPSDLINTSPLDPSLAGTANPEMATFLDLYNQALSSGALSDPTVLATVNSASSQIASLAEIVESVSPQLYAGAASSAAEVAALQASEASQVNSSQICTAGNFQDNGILCTP